MNKLNFVYLKNIAKKQITLSCYKFLLYHKSVYGFDKYPEKVKALTDMLNNIKGAKTRLEK
jgi:hypothetical protein